VQVSSYTCTPFYISLSVIKQRDLVSEIQENHRENAGGIPQAARRTISSAYLKEEPDFSGSSKRYLNMRLS